MATLTELVEAGSVSKIDPALPPDRQELRLLYASPRAQKWILEELPSVQAKWTTEVSPTEQLVTLVEDFCAGEELEYETGFHPLYPHEESIWELKTKDVRIFGWFYRRDCFVAVRIDSAERVKKHGLYAGYVGEVIRFRNEFAVDDPKFISGADPYAVVSNYHYP